MAVSYEPESPYYYKPEGEEIEDLRRRLLGSEWEDQVVEIVRAMPNSAAHVHGEYAMWNDLESVRQELTQVVSEFRELRERMAVPRHPLDHPDEQIEAFCFDHAQGRHRDPWRSHQYCPLCWDALHGGKGLDTTPPTEN